MTFGNNEAVVQVEYIDRNNYLKYKGKRVYVSGSVMLANCGLYELGIDFTYVGGSFICCFNKLTTLKGCPSFVGGTFDCSNNNLNSLQFYPEEISGEFDCYSNPITDVNHIPSYYDKIHKRCGQEDAIPLGWHRNAHENTFGTLFMFKLA